MVHKVGRPISITPRYTDHAEGSVLIESGRTKVLCNVSVQSKTPKFRKNSGWLTAEYSLLPRSTMVRTDREAIYGKQTGRTAEIQRFIARALRHCVDLNHIGQHTLMVDCDVLQADGGTRTAAVTGGCVAVYHALLWLKDKYKLSQPLFRKAVVGISVGIVKGVVCTDLNYQQDAHADVDFNVVMDEDGHFVELQATGERQAFNHTQLLDMLSKARSALFPLLDYQKSFMQSSL
jgi:ribonuclease PH